MDKRIIIHLGAHKTGTTTIQETLFENRDDLVTQGIYYLDMGSESKFSYENSNHGFNFVPILDTTLEDAYIYKRIKVEEREEFRQRKEKRFIDEYKKFLSNDELDIMIISAEAFELCDKYYYENLKNLLFDNKGEEDIQIEFVLYVREIKPYLLSICQEEIKICGQIKMDVILNRYFNYKKLIENISETFEESTIRVYKFDRTKLYKNSVLDDFLANICDREIRYKKLEDTNISISKNEALLRQEYFLRFRSTLPTFSVFKEYYEFPKAMKKNLEIDFKINKEHADRINENIEVVNTYLREDRKIELITPSEEETIYPTIKDVQISYIEKIIDIIEVNKLEIFQPCLANLNIILKDRKDMQNLSNKVAVYFFFDEDGIVDEYVKKFLHEIKGLVRDIVVVVNGKLTSDGRKTFENYTKDIIVRENVGMDVEAYKEALNYIGWENMRDIDELMLINYTIMGPIFPFREMFDEMDSREDVDFWGITKHHETSSIWFKTKYGYVPEHIQSSFIAIRNKMLNSYEYKKLWSDMPPIRTYSDSVEFYEAIFTKDFEGMGYKSDVYINTEDLRDFTRYPLLFMSHELVANRRCPVIKRKSFSQDYGTYYNETLGNETLKLFNYLKNDTAFDTDMILDNMIRTTNMFVLFQNLHWNYTLPSNIKISDEVEERKIGLGIHIYYEDLVEYCYNYVMNMPENSDIYITYDADEKLSSIKKVFENAEDYFNKIVYIKIENRGRDVSSLLIGCKDYVMDYDYFCYVHDKKTTQLQPLTKGQSFSDKCFENTLGSKEYVENIINLFEENKKLGVLSPTYPIHSDYNMMFNWEWSNNYDNVCDLVSEMGLNVNIKEDMPPIAPLGTMFWFRPKALKSLFEYNWTYESFPKEPTGKNDGTILHAIERIYGIVPQHEGYYSAYVLTEEMRRVENTNIDYLFRVKLNQMQWNNTLTGDVNTREFIKLKMKKKMNFNTYKKIVDMKRKILGPKGLEGHY